MKEYNYVGPTELLDSLGASLTKRRIHNQADVLDWIEQTGQHLDSAGEVIATFIIDTRGSLWVADRRSEHVACAGGGPVLSAGEMTFQVSGDRVEVTGATNQSTGFCPEPESWPSVAKALDACQLTHPGSFTTAFHFRLCRSCQSLNLVKEGWFMCDVCDADLSEKWNLA